MRNKLFAVIATIVVIVVGLVLWKAQHHDTTRDKLKLSQAIAKRGSIILKVTESGRVEPLTMVNICLLYTSPSPRDRTRSRMPSSA